MKQRLILEGKKHTTYFFVRSAGWILSRQSLHLPQLVSHSGVSNSF